MFIYDATCFGLAEYYTNASRRWFCARKSGTCRYTLIVTMYRLEFDRWKEIFNFTTAQPVLSHILRRLDLLYYTHQWMIFIHIHRQFMTRSVNISVSYLN